MPPDPNVHVGVAALVNMPYDPRGTGLLMIRRVGGTGLAADGHGTWSVPGGWLDFGETPQQAAEREVREETGVIVRARATGPYIVSTTERTIVTLFIYCTCVSGAPTVTEPDKCQDVQWLTWSEIYDGRPLFAPLRDYLKTSEEAA